MLDKIQKEMLGYNNSISPAYFPKVVPTQIDNKWVLVIVVRIGQQRPYKVPEYVTSKRDKKYSYYIRYLTNSVKVNPEQERELINMSDQTPFDCRANHKATFDDISPVLLEDHLRKTGSKLAKQVREREIEAILEDMQLLEGPRAEFFTDKDRRAMRIRIPIHLAFLEDLPNESNFKDSVKQNKNSLIEDLDEKATKKATKKLTNITLIK